MGGGVRAKVPFVLWKSQLIFGFFSLYLSKIATEALQVLSMGR